MPTRRTPTSTEYPFHLTARTNNRVPFPGDLEYIWKVFTGELLVQNWLNRFQIHAFLLMPNHFHLLASSPEAPVGDCMRNFLSSSTRVINSKNQITGRLFGGPYFGSLIKDPYYFLNAYKYVLRNPVRAKLCEYPADYPYSTYSGQIGFEFLPVPISMPAWDLGSLVPQDAESVDAWLSKPHRAEEEEAIRKALRKREVSISPNRSSRRKHRVEF